jgi:hypothetical protein
MPIQLIFDDEYLMRLVVKIVLIVLLALALVSIPIWVWADVDWEPNQQRRIILAIEYAAGLDKHQKSSWKSQGPVVVEKAMEQGLSHDLVLDLMQLALDAGWPVDTYTKICGLLIEKQDQGRDVRMAASKMAWNLFTGKKFYTGVTQTKAKTYPSRFVVVNADRFMQTLRKWLGTPYKYGGDSLEGVDCSAFVHQVYAKHGLIIPRGSFNQAKAGIPVDPAALRLGDLLVFSKPEKGVVHVGVYLSNGFFIHSAKGKGVHVSNLDEPKYRSMFQGARRLIRTVAL